MAITQDSVTTAALPSTGGTTLSWSHTCAAGATDLFVGISTRDKNGSTPQIATGVTYNSVALTSALTNANTNSEAEMWYLSTPTTGANTVAVTFANGTNVRGVACGISFLGSNGIGSTISSIGTSTNPNVGSLTVPTGDLELMVFSMGNGQTTSITGVDDGASSVVSTAGVSAGDSGTPLLGVASHAGAGSGLTTGMDTSASHAWAAVGVQVKAAAGGGGPPASTGTGSFFYFRRRR